MEEKDFYTILGVEKYSDIEACKKAYKTLVLKMHPDKLDHAPSEEEKARWQEVVGAYAILSRAESKNVYDQQLKSGIPHMVSASTFANFTSLANAKDEDFFKGAKDYIAEQQKLFDQYWVAKDCKNFFETYAKFAKFCQFYDEQIAIRKDTPFIKTEIVEDSIFYYPEVEFQINFGPEKNSQNSDKDFFIGLASDGYNLTIATKSDPTPKILDINKFLGYDSVLAPQLQKQIDEIRKTLEPIQAKIEAIRKDALFNKKSPGDIQKDMEALKLIKTPIDLGKYQSNWVEYISSVLYPKSPKESLIGERKEKTIEDFQQQYDPIGEAKNRQKIEAYSNPIESQLKKLEEKYTKKSAYASRAYCLWAEEKVYKAYGEKVEFKFTPLRWDTNFNEVAASNITPDQTEKFNNLNTEMFEVKKAHSSTLVLLFITLVQDIKALFKGIVADQVPVDSPSSEDLLLLEDSTAKTPPTKNTDQSTHSPPRSSNFTIFNATTPSSESNHTIANTDEKTKLAESIKEPLFNYIYDRSFEPKYAGSQFGFDIDTKLDAAESLYRVLYLGKSPQKLLEQPKLLDALKQGRLGNIAKEFVENYLEKNNQETLQSTRATF